MSYQANTSTMKEDVLEDVPSRPAVTKPRKPSRVGQPARARRQDAWRRKIGTKQLDEARKERSKLFNFDESNDELQRALEALHVTTQPVAVQLPVATRGVGIASAVEYSRMITTWNAAAILEICTIYQYYRVNLFLVWYKLYLAKYEQGELVSFDSTTGFFMDEETRQVLGPVTQTAISTYNIMCAVGKIEGSTVWHSIPKEGVPQTGEEAALYIYPPTIRAILDSISNADTPAQFRLDFYNLNPIPGARWNNDPAHGWLLTNANDIWPAGYDAQQLEADVHAYQNLLTRVSGRLPRSFVSHYVWSGKASKTGLVCSDPAQIRLNARFGPAPVVQERRRNVYGQYMEAVPLRGPTYLEDDVVGRATVKLHWSLDKETSALEMVAKCLVI